jgi:hypothetical protein
MRKNWVDKLKGGKADKCTPEDFDPKELKRGIKHEREHTSNKHIATEISMDHLRENKNYYHMLDRMEKKGKKK